MVFGYLYKQTRLHTLQLTKIYLPKILLCVVTVWKKQRKLVEQGKRCEVRPVSRQQRRKFQFGRYNQLYYQRPNLKFSSFVPTYRWYSAPFSLFEKLQNSIGTVPDKYGIHQHGSMWWYVGKLKLFYVQFENESAVRMNKSRFEMIFGKGITKFTFSKSGKKLTI